MNARWPAALALMGAVLVVTVALVASTVPNDSHLTAARATPAPSTELIPPMSAVDTTVTVPASESWPWAPLADCESGAWDATEPFGVVAGSRDWSDRRAGYEGGLHFAPGTWSTFRPAAGPLHAYDASPAVQVAVAERVLAAQGWSAWPVCSRKVHAR